MTQRRPRSWPSIAGTQTERATEAFRRLEDMTRLISEWVWETDADAVLTYVSERIIDRLGRHPSQVIGQRLIDVGEFPDLPDGNATPELNRPFRDIAFDASGTDGTLRHFLMSGLPRFDPDSGDFVGATGIAKDVTELVRVERANVRLADAIEVLSEYFALYDEHDQLVISNARFREFNKAYGAAARPGGHFDDLLRQEVADGRYPQALADPDAWIARRKRARTEAGTPIELEVAGGKWHSVSEERLPDGGVVMMVRDISDKKRDMETLRRSAQQHREFAADVAHKMRTPLAVMRSSLDRLDGDGRELIRDVDALARLVEQLLTMTRYRNFILYDDQCADLYLTVQGVLASMAPIAIKEGRSIELAGVQKQVLVHGDQGAIEHALRNLIENAIKYSSRGSTVRVVIDADPAQLRVIDQGRGIPMQARAQLFEPFSRSDRRGSGAGLGLSIVKAVADTHGAVIRVGEDPSGGSVFTLQFKPFDRGRAQTSSAL